MTDYEKQLTLILNAQNKASAEITKIERQLNKLEKGAKSTTGKMESQFRKVTGTLKKFAAGAATAYAAVKTFQKSAELARLGAQATQVETAFRSMAKQVGLNADQMVKSLKEASAATISEMDLMTTATRAMLFDIPADQMGKLMEVARAAATAQGTDTSQMFDDIVTGIARQSKMILDNLGINVSLEKAYEDYAKVLGKTSSALSDAEKKQAFFNSVLEEGERIIDRVGDAASELTDLERWQQLEAQFKDLSVTIGQRLAQAFNPVITKVSQWIEKMTEGIRIQNKINESRNAYASGIYQEGMGEGYLLERRQQLQGRLAAGAMRGINGDRLMSDAEAEAIRKRIENIDLILEQSDMAGGLMAMKETRDEMTRFEQAQAELAKLEAERETMLSEIAGYASEIPLSLDEQIAKYQEQIDKFAEFRNAERAAGNDITEVQKVLNWLVAERDALIGEKNKPAKEVSEVHPRTPNDLAAALAAVTGQSGPSHGAYAERLRARYARQARRREDIGESFNANFGHTDVISMVGGADPVSMILQAIMTAMAEIENLGKILNPVNTILESFFKVVGPVIDSVLQPLVNALQIIGSVLGQLFVPLFQAMAPAIDILAQILITVLVPVIELLAPIIATVAGLMELLNPILRAVAVAFEVLMAPVKWLADLFEWVADTIKTAVHNFVEIIEHPFNENKRDTWDYTQFSSDAFTGLEDRIAEIWNKEYDTGLNTTFQDIEAVGPSEIGSGAQYTQGKSYTINFYIEDNHFYGTGGMTEFVQTIREEFARLEEANL
jgi:phage-related protein